VPGRVTSLPMTSREQNERTTETIRDHFKRRKRRTLAVMVIGIAVGAAGVGCVFGDIGGSRFQPVLLAVAACGVAIILGALLHLDRTRCPKCLWRLGPLLNTPGLNFCIHCGISLDTPIYGRRRDP
jgi:sulfite exporter TauE/SafE